MAIVPGAGMERNARTGLEVGDHKFEADRTKGPFCGADIISLREQ